MGHATQRHVTGRGRTNAWQRLLTRTLHTSCNAGVDRERFNTAGLGRDPRFVLLPARRRFSGVRRAAGDACVFFAFPAFDAFVFAGEGLAFAGDALARDGVRRVAEERTTAETLRVSVPGAGGGGSVPGGLGAVEGGTSVRPSAARRRRSSYSSLNRAQPGTAQAPRGRWHFLPWARRRLITGRQV